MEGFWLIFYSIRADSKFCEIIGDSNEEMCTLLGSIILKDE